MFKRTILWMLSFMFLVGCSSQRISMENPVNRALKICGLGIDAKSADAYKAALEFASNKGTSFGSEASEAIETQIGILLKQADLKSDSGLKIVAEEMKTTRECVIRQVELMRPVKKSALLEQCRLDAQGKISPPGPIQYGVLRNWNQATRALTDADVVSMVGFFDNRGTTSFSLKVKCDIRGGTFNESVIETVNE